MLRTNTALWRIAFLTGLGVLPGACGAQTEAPLPAPEDGQDASVRDAADDPPAVLLSSPSPCLDSEPQLLASGADTGLERCSDGRVHRVAAVQCASSLPRDVAAQSPSSGGTCLTDSDCTEQPLGFCGRTAVIGFSSPVCRYGCLQDADCGPGFVCQCGDPVGECVAANCQTDDDCGTGFLCALAAPVTANLCSAELVFSCETPADECRTREDCVAGSRGSAACQTQDDVRSCVTITGACGRPFLVEGSARLAGTQRGSEWLASSESAPRVDQLSAAERAELARAWTELGLMEHASIAAFARFTLQLLSLGAPAALVEQSQQALADELLHARLCFSLASAYAGEALGPGSLPTENALDLSALEDIAALTLHEGCVGETSAALEASEALALATDPAVRRVLERIEADERRHAQLAWRFVSWAVRAGGASVQRRIERELTSLLAAPPAARPELERPSTVSAHGILSATRRAELRDAALRDVVLPCARALLPAARPAPRLSASF